MLWHIAHFVGLPYLSSGFLPRFIGNFLMFSCLCALQLRFCGDRWVKEHCNCLGLVLEYVFDFLLHLLSLFLLEYISDVNEILKGNYYSAEQKSAIKNIKTLHESQEKVIKVFNDYY